MKRKYLSIKYLRSHPPLMHCRSSYHLSQATLILTLGIEFGKIGYGNITEPVKYAGTGKVIRVG